MASLSVRHPQRNSLRLALLERSNKRAVGGSLLSLLSSQSRAAYRDSKRPDDRNGRNSHGTVSSVRALLPCLFVIFNRKNEN
jgi:hypothetical protein